MAVLLGGCQSTEEARIVDNWPAMAPPPAAGKRLVPDAFGLSPLARATAGPVVEAEGSGRFVGNDQRGPQVQTDAGESGITLNLLNVPVAQAAKTVLGDVLAVNYSISPKVEGNITLQTSQPVGKSQIVTLFEAALASNGAAIVQKGALYSVVPLDEARTGTRLKVGNAPDVVGTIGNGLQVVQLKYVSASEIKRVLEPIAPAGGIVRTDDTRNVITLAGTQEQLATMLDTISVFDVDTMKGMSFALVPVANGQPDAIADDLKTVWGSDKDGTMSSAVRFLPNKRLGAILIATTQPRYLARAEAWVRRLDGQAQGADKQIYAYTVQNRPAKELVDVVQAMFGKDGVPAPGHKLQRQDATPAQDGAAAQPQVQIALQQPYGALTGVGQSPGTPGTPGAANQTSFGTGPNPEPEYVSARVGATGPEESRIKIVADDPNNSLIISATPEDYRRVRSILENLDVAPNQVLLETTIAEVTLNDQLQFGLRWYFQGKHNSYTFSDAATAAGTAALNGVFPGFSYALQASNAQVTLNALADITKVSVVSSPSVMVVDNKKAQLQVGDDVPTLTQTAVGVVSPGSPVIESIAYIPTGVILSVTPRINDSGRVTLDIEQEVSSVVPTTSSSIDTPTIRKRRVRTTVVVNDGEALVLGGLIQSSDEIDRTQVPVLGSIPVVGTLFRQKIDKIAKTELVVLITPRVVRDPRQARAATDEYRRKIELNTPHPTPADNIANTVKRIVN